MSAKTKIVVIKLKDVLFYATVAILCIIALLLLYILFQSDTTTTNSTIDVKIESMDGAFCFMEMPTEFFLKQKWTAT